MCSAHSNVRVVEDTQYSSPKEKNMKGLIKAVAITILVAVGANASADDHGMKKDIVDTAVAAGSFDTLVAAVEAAGLVETLKGEGPFTVFAPTDEAFAALPEGTVESLLEEENRDQLVAILTYHVVPGEVTAAQVIDLDIAETVQGDTIDITVEDGMVMVDGATVVQA